MFFFRRPICPALKSWYFISLYWVIFFFFMVIHNLSYVINVLTPSIPFNTERQMLHIIHKWLIVFVKGMIEMRSWISVLFYIICFFVVATVIYRLAFLIPPKSGEEGYLLYWIGTVFFSIFISGAAVGFAAAFDWYSRRRRGDDK